MSKPKKKAHCLGLDLFMIDANAASSELHHVVKQQREGWQGDIRLALDNPGLLHQLEIGIYDDGWMNAWDKALGEMGIKHSWRPCRKCPGSCNLHIEEEK